MVGQSVDRIPVEARFSTPVQTGSGAHPVSCTLSTGFFFPVVKRTGCGVTHQHPGSAKVKERVNHTSDSLIGLHDVLLFYIL